MKLALLALAFGLFIAETHAQDLSLENFNWTLTDVSSRNVTKEELFKKMDRKTIVARSICANRALMWLYEFKKNSDIDGSKIFVFYTGSRTRFSVRSWWYHVAPIINENGKEYVMDAGFPGSIKGPVTPDVWLKNFVGNNNCYEIKSHDLDLADLMYKGAQFPKETFRGSYDCYYVKAPAGFQFPYAVANAMYGKAVSHEITEASAYSACLEASTGPIGGLLRAGKKKCKEFISR